MLDRNIAQNKRYRYLIGYRYLLFLQAYIFPCSFHILFAIASFSKGSSLL